MQVLDSNVSMGNSKATLSAQASLSQEMQDVIEEMSTATDKLAKDHKNVMTKMAKSTGGMDEYKTMCLDVARLEIGYVT